jgi:pimeloyl-ACP methyl ester carboxylesterase
MLIGFFLGAALQASPPPSAGRWEGYMQRGAARLQVAFDFTAETPVRGLFSAPDLGAMDIPLSDVQLGREIHWQLVGDASTTTFDGTLQAGSMAGAFRDPAGNGIFTLHRLSTTTIKPYDERSVTFANGSVRLAGTVYAPRAAGKYPAVIFVHGSGAEGRWANAYLADYVARRGVVALIYDKRGVGASSGDWRTSTMQALADDARAGVDLLAHRSDVDAGKIGVYGHSQGGELAASIAEHNGQVGWIIAADSPVGPQYRQDLYRVDTMLATMYSGKDLADAKVLYAEFVDVARAGASHDTLRADIAAAGSARWLADLGIPDDASWIWDWYDKVGNYDNASAWGAIRIRVLLLFGAEDALVPAQASIAQATAILRSHGNERVTVRVFPGADHTLRVPASTADGWPHAAAGFPQIIVTFARGELQP